MLSTHAAKVAFVGGISQQNLLQKETRTVHSHQGVTGI